MARSVDPALLELNRRAKAHWARLTGYLAGRPIIQVKDFALEAGLGHDYYTEDLIYMAEHHVEKLFHLGYRPIIVPAMSGKLGVLVLVRGKWPLDDARPPIHPRLLPYLENGDPLMALLVGRVQREMDMADGLEKESGHGRT